MAQINNWYYKAISKNPVDDLNVKHLEYLTGLTGLTIAQQLHHISGGDPDKLVNEYLRLISGGDAGWTNNQYLELWYENNKFEPPQLSSVLQWLNGGSESVGNFDSQYVTFDGADVAVSHLDSWVLGFDLIPTDLTTEVNCLFSENLSGALHFDIGQPSIGSSDLYLVWRQGGDRIVIIPEFFTSLGEHFSAEFELSNGVITVTKNGTLFDSYTAPSANTTQANLSYLSRFRSDIDRPFIGYMSNFNANGELFKIDEGSGSVVYGSEGSEGVISGDLYAFWKLSVLTDNRFNSNSKQVINVLAVGDSITSILAHSWIDRYFNRIRIDNMAVSGSTSEEYLAILKAQDLSGYDIVFYPPFTPNDPIALASTQIQIDRAIEAHDYCYINDTKCVFSWCAPVDANNATQDGYRTDVYDYLDGQGYEFLNMISAVSEGTIPDRFKSGYTPDGIHPSNIGYQAMSDEFYEPYINAQKVLFSVAEYNHGLKQTTPISIDFDENEGDRLCNFDGDNLVIFQDSLHFTGDYVIKIKGIADFSGGVYDILGTADSSNDRIGINDSVDSIGLYFDTFTSASFSSVNIPSGAYELEFRVNLSIGTDLYINGSFCCSSSTWGNFYLANIGQGRTSTTRYIGQIETFEVYQTGMLSVDLGFTDTRVYNKVDNADLIQTDPNSSLLTKGTAYPINIDPNGTLETALGLTAGTLNLYATRAQLDQIYSDLVVELSGVYAFISPIVADSTLSDPTKFRTVFYNLLADLDDAQELENQKYTGRDFYYLLDSNNEQILDSNGIKLAVKTS